MWLSYSNCYLRSFEMSSESDCHHLCATGFDLMPLQNSVKFTRFVADFFGSKIVTIMRFMMTVLWIAELASVITVDFVRVLHHLSFAFSYTHAIVFS